MFNRVFSWTPTSRRRLGRRFCGLWSRAGRFTSHACNAALELACGFSEGHFRLLIKISGTNSSDGNLQFLASPDDGLAEKFSFRGVNQGCAARIFSSAGSGRPEANKTAAPTIRYLRATNSLTSSAIAILPGYRRTRSGQGASAAAGVRVALRNDKAESFREFSGPR